MYFSLRRKMKKWALLSGRCTSSANRASQRRAVSTKDQIRPLTPTTKRSTLIKKVDKEQHFLSLIVTGVALQQRDKRKVAAPVEEPASEGLVS
jgi:hypothetical protein